jgi:hypothetical protein
MSRRDRDTVARGMNDIFRSTDLLGNVIRSDRTRAGRAAPPPPEAGPTAAPPLDQAQPSDVMTRQNVIREYDNTTDEQADNGETGQADNQAGPVAPGQASTHRASRVSTPPRQENRKKPPKTAEAAELLAGRLAEGQRMAESPTTTVTLRIPREVNAWLDEYIHRAWPARVHKQDLVTEALQILFARRGRPGEPILETELFAERKT